MGSVPSGLSSFQQQQQRAITVSVSLLAGILNYRLDLLQLP
jgi:hypothetical protein